MTNTMTTKIRCVKRTLLKSLTSLMLVTSCAVALAQVPTDDIKVGTVLDASGVQMKGLTANALPLPPGKWEVVGRVDGTGDFTYYVSATLHYKTVTLSLLNQDSSSPLAAISVFYTHEQLYINWSATAKCEDAKATFVNDFGTSPQDIQNGCARSYFNGTESFKQKVLASPDSKNEFNRIRLSPFIPVADRLIDGYVWTHMRFTRDKRGLLNFLFISKPTPEMKVGDKTDTDLKTWVASVGKTYLAYLNSVDLPVPTFPAQ